ncbi:cytochrome c-type biogenesis protein [Cognatishimia activa]|uniref:Cytochrome c-type biogenesis protein n=1 Tax=Cognatishimia activa TaxID=1715691 RepID=A0A0P1IU48_9RHOB|nr:cytochrome c-type biogenesis protein [Cognatishimia activa]CUJ35714.1 Cytochrome c-type biogenesis protein CcmH precursor [Cognatishimia activa]CUK27027.1 Cytochrome c-type biogenesis protein CcmH precursor [Cognatishimia activa]
MKRLLIIATVLSGLLFSPVAAVEPSEIMDDPAMETRARIISKNLRCLVCRNESIDESNAGIAKDLRLLVRERLEAGDSNAEVVAFVVDRYGEYVLLRPQTGGSNLLLWGAGPAMLIVALGLSGYYLRRRSRAKPAKVDALSEDEKARLAEILKD